MLHVAGAAADLEAGRATLEWLGKPVLLLVNVPDGPEADPPGLVARADTWSDDKLHRTLQLAPAGVPVAMVDERTALIRHADGTWRADGAGKVTVWMDGHQADVDVLPG